MIVSQILQKIFIGDFLMTNTLQLGRAVEIGKDQIKTLLESSHVIRCKKYSNQALNYHLHPLSYVSCFDI